MLDSRDALPCMPRRVLVAGVSGVGKSTLAARIALQLDIPYLELDALFHGPLWTRLPTFESDVEAFAETDAWVTEWQYQSVRDLLASKADTVVWLDLPFRITLWRVVRRTVNRSRRKTLLWNGNREPGLWHALTRREGIIRWSIQTRRKCRRLVPAAAAAHPALQIVRLRTRREVRGWVDGPLRKVRSGEARGHGVDRRLPDAPSS